MPDVVATTLAILWATWLAGWWLGGLRAIPFTPGCCWRRQEESLLTTHFGAACDSYRADVPMLVPFIR